jgi:hypothetical protein
LSATTALLLLRVAQEAPVSRRIWLLVPQFRLQLTPRRTKLRAWLLLVEVVPARTRRQTINKPLRLLKAALPRMPLHVLLWPNRALMLHALPRVFVRTPVPR